MDLTASRSRQTAPPAGGGGGQAGRHAAGPGMGGQPQAQPGGLVARRVAQTRREVTAAAARLFIERGYETTTVYDIAVAAGISPRTFFRYFSAKEEVVDELLDEGIRLFAATLEARPTTEALLDTLRVAGGQSLAAAAEQGVLELFTVVRRTPALRARWLTRWNTYAEIITQALRERLPRDAPETADLAAGALIGMMTAIVDLFIDQPHERLVELLDASYQALVNGFAPTAGANTRP